MKDATPTCRIRRLHMPQFDAVEASNFANAVPVQLVETVTGKKPKQGTEVRLAWDPDRLYACFACKDIQPLGTMTKHDDPLYEEDVCELFIDPYGYGSLYYELEVNPLNATFDAIIINDIKAPGRRGSRFQGFTGWDPKSFVSKTRTTEQGWETILAIDFDDLFLGPRVPPQSGDVWRANILRCDVLAGVPEYCAWSPTGLPDFHNSKCFGQWVFE
jgi:hypothetical protein